MKTFPSPLLPYKKQEEAIKKEPILLECIYGSHKADVLHRGTAYCRACYDRKNPLGELIN